MNTILTVNTRTGAVRSSSCSEEERGWGGRSFIVHDLLAQLAAEAFAGRSNYRVQVDQVGCPDNDTQKQSARNIAPKLGHGNARGIDTPDCARGKAKALPDLGWRLRAHALDPTVHRSCLPDHLIRWRLCRCPTPPSRRGTRMS